MPRNASSAPKSGPTRKRPAQRPRSSRPTAGKGGPPKGAPGKATPGKGARPYAPRSVAKSGKLGRRKPLWLTICLIAAIALVGGFVFVWSAIDGAAQVNDATQSDAVVVLGCAVWPNGQPSPALRERIREGVRVWRATGSRYLLVTGGVGAYPPAEAVVMRGIAEKAGVPPASIIDDQSAHTTEDSALMCAKITRRMGWKRVTLVSDPWHLLRARQLFVDYARDSHLDVHQSPAYLSPAWTEPGVRVRYTLRECIGVTVYWVKRLFR